VTGPSDGTPQTKPYVLRPQAREDRRSEVRYYRQEAGAAVADKLVKAMAKALQDLERNPSIGSPSLGRLLGIEELRTWRLQGFPLTFWYFERVDHIEVIRLVGQRQDLGDVQV
jgi:toxin ParE1/3/4